MWGTSRIHPWSFTLLIYINDLPHATTLFSVLFADDTNMFDSSKDINGLIANINTELGKVCDWLYANKLSTNVSKTHFMVWSPRKAKLEDLGPITLNGQEMDWVTETKFLGIILDESLSWKPHIYYVRNKISKAAGILKKLRAYVNIDTMVNLYYSFVYPYLLYCVHVWGKTYVTHLECLNIMKKRAL